MAFLWLIVEYREEINQSQGFLGASVVQGFMVYSVVQKLTHQRGTEKGFCNGQYLSQRSMPFGLSLMDIFLKHRRLGYDDCLATSPKTIL